MSGEPYITISVERKRSLPNYESETIRVTLGQIPADAPRSYIGELLEVADSAVDLTRDAILRRIDQIKPLASPERIAQADAMAAAMMMAPAKVEIEPAPDLTQSNNGVVAVTALEPAPPAAPVDPVLISPAAAMMAAPEAPVPVLDFERIAANLAAAENDDLPPSIDDAPNTFGLGVVTFGHPFGGYEFSASEGHDRIETDPHKLRALNSLMRNTGFADIRHEFARVVTGRRVDSTKDLTFRECERISDFLLHATDEQKKSAYQAATK